MNDITIQGLTPRQQTLADILWSFDHQDQVDQFISALPEGELQSEAQSIVYLILLAVQESEEDQDSQQIAEDLLNRLRSK
jgi:hypothetical protein